MPTTIVRPIQNSTYLILPLCLIQAISMNGIMGGAMGIAAAKEAGTNSLAAIGMQFWVNYGLMFLCYLVGSILLTSIIYGLMQVYNQREERLAGVTFADLKPFLFKNIRRLLVMVLFCIAEKHKSVIYPELHSDGR